ncbi:DJ-1/PfpI family protein, partial [Pseudomonas fluorescens]
GSLVLGAAAPLNRQRTPTHHTSHPPPPPLPSIAVPGRVVRDGNLLNGGGITAGIDFSLTMAAEPFNKATAERAQLTLEYTPVPQF